MKRIVIALMLLCLMMSAMSVSAENISRIEDISLGQTKVVTVPQPEGEIDEGWVYFTQEFTFVPEQSGTYRFLVSYEEDEQTPYDFNVDVAGAYLELENGIEFDAIAGQTYHLGFQYPNHDGRYPEFTFYLGTADVEQIPETGDVSLLLPAGLLILAAAGIILTATKRKLFQ